MHQFVYNVFVFSTQNYFTVYKPRPYNFTQKSNVYFSIRFGWVMGILALKIQLIYTKEENCFENLNVFLNDYKEYFWDIDMYGEQHQNKENHLK